MRPLSRLIVILALARPSWAQIPAVAPTALEIGKPIPHLTGELIEPTAEAKTSAFDSGAAKSLTVYVIVGTHCPSTQLYSERMAQLAKDYGARNVEFLYVYPSRDEDRDAKISFHRQHNLGGRLIDDQQGKIARQFGAEKTTEIFVADAKGMLVYHGAIDDWRDDPKQVKNRYLATALDEVLAGKPVTTSSSQVYACGIHY